MKSIGALVLESRLESLSLVRRYVSGTLTGILSAAERDMAVLCAVEAVTNCVIHAYRRRPGRPIELEVCYDDKRLTMRVRDQGRSMPRGVLAAAGSAVEEPEALRAGGRGLFVMRSVMGRVTYRRRRGVNELTMTRRFGGAA